MENTYLDIKNGLQRVVINGQQSEWMDVTILVVYHNFHKDQF